MFVITPSTKSAIWRYVVPRWFVVKTTRRPSGETSGSMARNPSVSRARFASSPDGLVLPRGMSWTDVEIRAEDSNHPKVQLTGTVRDLAVRLKVGEVLLSMAHCRAYATASALAVRGILPAPG